MVGIQEPHEERVSTRYYNLLKDDCLVITVTRFSPFTAEAPGSREGVLDMFPSCAYTLLERGPDGAFTPCAGMEAVPLAERPQTHDYRLELKTDMLPARSGEYRLILASACARRQVEFTYTHERDELVRLLLHRPASAAGDCPRQL